MSAVSTQFTLADLERMPDDGIQREILHGELIELLPPILPHEDIAAIIHESLAVFNRQAKLGRVYGSRMGYKVLRDDHTWIEPDVSFLMSRRRQANAGNKYVDGAPELAVEIISPSESAQDVEGKVEAYLQGGAHAVVVIYPKTSTIKLHLADGSVRTFRTGDALSLPDLLPGWDLPVSEIFGG